jgi:pyruvate/2-oxoglutarate dehydrogenase complex dihydrolipoamide dehydrogenase (E3) component
MAQAFRRLGSKVTVVGSDPEILPHDDKELAALLRTRLEVEGIQFLLGVRATGAEKTGAGIVVHLSNGSRVECDALLMSAGREVDTSALRLDAAGVTKSKEGSVVVDGHCRTSRRNIYAVGDVTGRQQFTHMAEHMAKIAITNCILRWPASIDKTIPWCTFTSPELAHTGCDTDVSEGASAGRRVVLRFPMRRVDRAVVDGDADGLVKGCYGSQRARARRLGTRPACGRADLYLVTRRAPWHEDRRDRRDDSPLSHVLSGKPESSGPVE